MYAALVLLFLDQELQAQSLLKFSAIAVSNGDAHGDASNAVDGDSGTWSYLTLPYSQVPQTALLDFGTNASIGGFAWVKEQQNFDASDYIHSFLSISISSDSVTIPVSGRAFVPLNGMLNGYGVSNLVQIDSVGSFNSNGTITREFGKGIGNGLTVSGATYAVTFPLITNATAIAFTFQDTDPIIRNWPPYTLGWTHCPPVDFYGIMKSTPSPALTIQKAVYVTSTNLSVGSSYLISR